MRKAYISMPIIFAFMTLGFFIGFGAFHIMVIDDAYRPERQYPELMKFIAAQANDPAMNARRENMREIILKEQEKLLAFRAIDPKQIFFCPAVSDLYNDTSAPLINSQSPVNYDKSFLIKQRTGGAQLFQGVKLKNNQVQCVYGSTIMLYEESAFYVVYEFNNTIKIVGLHWRVVPSGWAVCDSIDVETCAFAYAD